MEKLLRNEDEFNQFIGMTEYSLLHFSANWSEICEQLNNLLSELKDELKCFDFAVVEAEEIPEVSAANKIVAAPTVLFFKKGKEVDRLEGFDPGELRAKIIKHNFIEGVVSMTKKVIGDEKNSFIVVRIICNKMWNSGGLDILREELNDPEFCSKLPKLKNRNGRLKTLINKAPLMLFMKGSPETPKCRFSKKIIELLNDVNAAYSFFDILKDDEIRQGLKEYSNWPTYPQLYLNGELIGGLDLVTEELKNPTFIDKLPRKS